MRGSWTGAGCGPGEGCEGAVTPHAGVDERWGVRARLHWGRRTHVLAVEVECAMAGMVRRTQGMHAGRAGNEGV